MPGPLDELRERLLRAGVAPRHVRRYLSELSDHLADLLAEEERAGRSRRDAETAALARLGSADQLAKAMVGQRQFKSWCARAPWAMFSVTPLVLLLLAYLFSSFILWSGWQLFLPTADTPFGHSSPAIYTLQNIYFQIGRIIYFTAPVVIGLTIGLAAIRQRLKAVWPMVGIALVAWMGGTAQIHASRIALSPRLGNIALTFFVPPPDQTLSQSLLHVLMYFALATVPFLIWRWRRRRSVFVAR